MIVSLPLIKGAKCIQISGLFTNLCERQSPIRSAERRPDLFLGLLHVVMRNVTHHVMLFAVLHCVTNRMIFHLVMMHHRAVEVMIVVMVMVVFCGGSGLPRNR